MGPELTRPWLDVLSLETIPPPLEERSSKQLCVSVSVAIKTSTIGSHLPVARIGVRGRSHQVELFSTVPCSAAGNL